MARALPNRRATEVALPIRLASATRTGIPQHTTGEVSPHGLPPLTPGGIAVPEVDTEDDPNMATPVRGPLHVPPRLDTHTSRSLCINVLPYYLCCVNPNTYSNICNFNSKPQSRWQYSSQ